MGDVNGWKIAGDKIKGKYESFQWNQHETGLDIFEDINRVKAYCGNFGDSVEETTCWLDTFNWSVMNKTKLSEDIYQFISHRAGVIRGGVDREIEGFHFNWEVFEPAKAAFASQLKKGFINLIEWII